MKLCCNGGPFGPPYYGHAADCPACAAPLPLSTPMVKTTDTIQTMRDMDTAIRATVAILVGIVSCDFATNYGTYTAYALREYKADIAADILKAIWGRDVRDTEREYLCYEENWPRLEGFALVNNPTGKL